MGPGSGASEHVAHEVGAAYRGQSQPKVPAVSNA